MSPVRLLTQTTIEALLVSNTEWAEADDWWSGGTDVYDNAPNGFEINVYDKTFNMQLADGEFRCDVYKTVKKGETGELNCYGEENILFHFIIKPMRKSVGFKQGAIKVISETINHNLEIQGVLNV